jgi:Rv0078B-related antitoxin
MTKRTFNDEVLSDEMAAIYRAMTPSQKLAIVDRMWRSARRMIRANLAREHPDWTSEELDRETARRMSRGAF